MIRRECELRAILRRHGGDQRPRAPWHRCNICTLKSITVPDFAYGFSLWQLNYVDFFIADPPGRTTGSRKFVFEKFLQVQGSMVETIFSQYSYFARFLKENKLHAFHNPNYTTRGGFGQAEASLRVLSRGDIRLTVSRGPEVDFSINFTRLNLSGVFFQLSSML